ncbi:MAG: M1 family metallopeptidase [Acidobacteria bacterium]|nr:M1 family metallopeptidase [Acidobacteriota bacterium]
MRMQGPSIAAIILVLSPLAMGAQSIATNSPNGAPLSERVVAYTIDARLDTIRKTLDATESLTYRNLSGQPLAIFPFHLYLNAFRPESTFSAETRAGGGVRGSIDSDYAREKIGGITVSRVDADGYGDLTSAMRFTAPDDGNAQDHTVVEITLPRPLAPNDSVTFHFVFHDRFPESVARNGYKRDFIMGGQWFPKIGVFSHGAWNCHQYHATTEFFSDFGTYNVRLTVPRNYTVGASGVPTAQQPNADGTKTLTFVGEDIHDFAFAASPNFVVTDSIYLSSLGPVQIHILALAAHPGIGQRYLDITRSSLAAFERRYGPYPYKILTVVDPEPGSEIAGMEYPTLVTGDGTWTGVFNMPELTVNHEFGHQYWYGMVASNEFEEPWLDEGINSFTEVTTLADISGSNRSVINQRYANMGDASLQRLQYLLSPDFDPVTRVGWKFRNITSYGAVTYGKSSTLLATLEGLIGRDTMNEAMRTYFQRFRFKHPTTEDFLRTVEEVAVRNGKATASNDAISLNGPPPLNVNGMPETSSLPAIHSSLRPFFDQAVYGTQMLDYAVDSAWSDPVSPGSKQYLSTVYLRRKGDFILPVTADVIFDDGSRVHERWDGVDRWTRFTYTRNSKITSVEIDPGHLIPLDRNVFNNSFTTHPNPLPARKLSAIWLALQQLGQQLLAWVV